MIIILANVFILWMFKFEVGEVTWLSKSGPSSWQLVHCVFSAWAQADSLSEQRTRYQEIKAAWDAKDTCAQVEKLLPTLQDYPLYPLS